MNKATSLGIVFIFSMNCFLGSATYASPSAGKLEKFIGDNQFSSNVFELNSRAGVVGAPQNQPWSGTFWPLRSGSTGNAYNDQIINGSFIFKVSQLFSVKAKIKSFHKRMSDLRAMIATNKLDAKKIDNLSPAEKYDLYLSDYDFSFTNAEWQSVSEQFDYIGRISLWEGSCHGWSQAAIHEPRPSRAINVMSLDGKYLIPFYPDDLKGLATRLWANSLIQDYTVSQGLRCNKNNPITDPATGKVLDANCEGVNPGDFHVSVLELVGKRKQSFVMNRKNTKSVWNQPVAGYELHYFNPATEEIGELNQSVVRLENYNDPYKNFRTDAVKSVVGVEMDLKYSSETAPSHASSNGVSDDKIKTLSVRYDLELDQNNSIIGGEWRNSVDPTGFSNDSSGSSDESVGAPQYPGFLWKFADAHPIAYSEADTDIPGNDLSKVDVSILIAASKKAAQFRYNHYNYDAKGNATTVKRAELKPQPLEKVVSTLIDLAK